MAGELIQHLDVATGMAMTVTGVALLRKAWRERKAGHLSRRKVFVTVAWQALCVAFVPWAFATGADKGAAFALIVLMLTGSALVIRAGLQHEPRKKPVAEREPRSNGDSANAAPWPLFLRRSCVFLLAGPVSGAAAMFIGVVMYGLWDVANGSAANRLAAVLLFVPACWALLAVWTTCDVPLRWRSSSAVALLLLGISGTFLLMPEVT